MFAQVLERITPRQRDIIIIVGWLAAMAYSSLLFSVLATPLLIGVVVSGLFGKNFFNVMREWWTHAASRKLLRKAKDNSLTVKHARWLLTPGLLRGAAGFEGVTTTHTTSVLHWAARWGRMDLITLFLEKGIKLTLLNANNETVLHIALKHQQAEIIKFLRTRSEFSQFLKIPSHSEQDSPLDIVAAAGNVVRLGNFIKLRKQPLTTQEKFKLASKAVMNGHIPILKFLYEEYNENLLEWNSDKGENLLHVCARFDQRECLNYLFVLFNKIEEKDLNKPNNDGYTPYDIAVERGAHLCMALFHSQGARTTHSPTPRFTSSYGSQSSPSIRDSHSAGTTPTSSPESQKVMERVPPEMREEHPSARRRLIFE